jgi:hypothetical protein
MRQQQAAASSEHGSRAEAGEERCEKACAWQARELVKRSQVSCTERAMYTNSQQRLQPQHQPAANLGRSSLQVAVVLA